MRRSGFTLIELLIAMGVLMILIALVFVGMGYVGATAKKNATKTTLANCQSMLSAYAAATKQLKRQPAFIWIGEQSKDVNLLNNPIDLWRDPVVSPGSVAPDVVERWSKTGSEQLPVPDAVRNTGIAWMMMRQIPENSKAIEQMPERQKHLALRQWIKDAPYKKGDLVSYAEDKQAAKVYACKFDLSVSSAEPPGDKDNWEESYSTFIDAWGNPIIFVPAKGMLGTVPEVPPPSNSTYSKGQRVMYNGVIYTALKDNPSGAPDQNTGVDWGGLTSPDFQPFWASAGPDGDFAKGDDNVYSFEQ